MLQHCSRLLWPMLTPGSTAELLSQYHFSVKCYLAWFPKTLLSTSILKENPLYVLLSSLWICASMLACSL